MSSFFEPRADVVMPSFIRYFEVGGPAVEYEGWTVTTTAGYYNFGEESGNGDDDDLLEKIKDFWWAILLAGVGTVFSFYYLKRRKI